MADGKRSWVPRDVCKIGNDVAEMLDLRRRLAEAEVRADLKNGKRLAIVAGIGVVMAIVGVSLLTVVLAARADAALVSSAQAFPHVSFWLSLVLIVIGSFTIWREVCRFRSKFCGLRESLAELKEDLVWLREWFPADAEDQN